MFAVREEVSSNCYEKVGGERTFATGATDRRATEVRALDRNMLIVLIVDVDGKPRMKNKGILQWPYIQSGWCKSPGCVCSAA